MTSNKAKKTVDKKYLSDIRVELIFYCLNLNLTEADIARIFNIDKSSIHRIIKKHENDSKLVAQFGR